MYECVDHVNNLLIVVSQSCCITLINDWINDDFCFVLVWECINFKIRIEHFDIFELFSLSSLPCPSHTGCPQKRYTAFKKYLGITSVKAEITTFSLKCSNSGNFHQNIDAKIIFKSVFLEHPVHSTFNNEELL